MLPDDTIAAIFTKLLLVYGRRFSDAYAGQDLGTVKRHWQHELGAMPDWAVTHALATLPPDFPPNVLQFKAICNTARPPMRQALPTPRGAPMKPATREALQQLVRQFASGSTDPLIGARALRDKERRGFHLTRAQREFWRTALRHEENT